ncbi:MAG: signal recognition particle protein [Hyphomicrobiaceae bacterium]|nr:signal recognition particle protein [Hyphomicrobiaceae bacterium]
MFQTLSDRLSAVFDRLTKRGALSESDVAEAMREVRRALLEADVALDVVRSFIDCVKEKAVGREVVRSVTPGQMVVKIVHDELVAMLGSDADPIDLEAAPPVGILMVGLQGSGKTTTTAKIGYRLKTLFKKKALMASLDTRRPAAQEQLRVLGEQAGVDTLPIVTGQTPQQIALRAQQAARLGGYDVVIFDTAGRVTLDEALMLEAKEVRELVAPHEVLLVADSLTGQDAVNTAKAFDSRIGLTGIVLTRADGDGRGGAALSMRAVTGKPIKLIGVGEKWDQLEDFHPQRVAGRILGMGDVVSLVEKAAQTIDVEKAQKIALKMKKGAFDLEDLAEQLKQMQKLGGMGGVMGMLPGMGKLRSQLDAANLDDKVFKRQGGIISSMTPYERRNPKALDARRKRRIAAGSGTKVEEINRLLKMHRQMADMMKVMGKKGMMGRMMGGLGLPGMGGGGAHPSEAELAAMQADLAKLDPKALEQLPKELRDQVQGLTGGGKSGPGLGGGLPKLPGLGGAPMGLPGLPGAARGVLPKLPLLPGLPNQGSGQGSGKKKG